MMMLLDAYPENIANREITRYVLNLMRVLYAEKTPYKYYHTDMYDLRRNPDLIVIQNILDLINQKQYTLFKKFLLLRMNSYLSGEYVFSAEVFMSETDFAEMKDSLLEMKATLFLLDDRINEAITVYLSLPKKMQSKQIFIDPFKASIHDVIWYYDYNGNRISKLEFAQELLELKDSIKNDPQNARAYYLLANAYYNVTYFGKSWNLVSYFRSGSYYSGFTDCS